MNRMMVVVAHPDDETFGCGSLLLHAAATGMVTAVLCATRGEAGEATEGTRGDIGAVREAETRSAAKILGVKEVEFLGFRDSGMAGDAGPETLVGAAFEEVRDQLAERVAAFAPSVVVSLDGSDGHRDHARIGAAALAAVELTGGVESAYLHCLPQSLMRRWIDHMAGADPSWEHLRLAPPGTPDELITTVIDTREHRSARERAIRRHASQRSPFDGLPEDLYGDFLTAEHLRRVRPDWPGGPIEHTVMTTGKEPEL